MKEKFNEALGKKIEKIRKDKGISMNELAKAIGKDYHSILRLEQGKTNPSYYYIYEIAKGLDTNMDELVKRLP
jgi:putative transcriptional regulator